MPSPNLSHLDDIVEDFIDVEDFFETEDFVDTEVYTQHAQQVPACAGGEQTMQDVAMIHCVKELQNYLTPEDEDMMEWTHLLVTEHQPIPGSQQNRTPDCQTQHQAGSGKGEQDRSQKKTKAGRGKKGKAGVEKKKSKKKRSKGKPINDTLLVGSRILPEWRQGKAAHSNDIAEGVRSYRRRCRRLRRHGPTPSPLSMFSFSATPAAASAASPPIASPESTHFALPLSPPGLAGSPSRLSTVTSALRCPSSAADLIARAAPASPPAMIGLCCDLDIHDVSDSGARTPRGKRAREGDEESDDGADAADERVKRRR